MKTKYGSTEGRVVYVGEKSICVLYEVGETEYFLTETLEYKKIDRKILGIPCGTKVVPSIGKKSEGYKVEVMVNANNPFDSYINKNKGERIGIKEYKH